MWRPLLGQGPRRGTLVSAFGELEHEAEDMLFGGLDRLIHPFSLPLTPPPFHGQTRVATRPLRTTGNTPGGSSNSAFVLRGAGWAGMKSSDLESSSPSSEFRTKADI